MSVESKVAAPVDLVAAEFEKNPDFQECENRPWASMRERDATGCVANDFVLHNPKVGLRFFWNEKEKMLCGSCTFGVDAEGPPKGAHGASIALVFDEILAYPVWRSGTEAFTVNLNISLRRMIPIGTTQRFEAKVTHREGRKIHVFGQITSADRKVVWADCKGLWVSSDKIKSIGGVRAEVVGKAKL